MRMFPSFSSLLPWQNLSFMVWIVLPVWLQISQAYVNREKELVLQVLRLEASDRTPVAGAAYFHLMEVLSSSLLLHQAYDRRVPLSRHNYMKFECAVTIFA
jgi:hypothetical protein